MFHRHYNIPLIFPQTCFSFLFPSFLHRWHYRYQPSNIPCPSKNGVNLVMSLYCFHHCHQNEIQISVHLSGLDLYAASSRKPSLMPSGPGVPTVQSLYSLCFLSHTLSTCYCCLLIIARVSFIRAGTIISLAHCYISNAQHSA